jgi:NADP-dependent 3-hydroxy acid dehydrogenase YdfG
VWRSGAEDQLAIRPSGILARRLFHATDGRDGQGRDDQVTPLAGPCALLVGGTGGIGRQIARWLAERGTSRIVMVSRRGRDGTDLSGTEAQIAAAGGKLKVVAADAADAAALKAIRSDLATAGTPVTSVWHLAGGGTLEPVDTLSPGAFAATAHAKIGGADAIDAAFDDPAVPVILFSSISAVWGSAEHGAYAAANAYLDAMADSRRARGLPTWSIAWGIWDPAEAGGMAQDLWRICPGTGALMTADRPAASAGPPAPPPRSSPSAGPFAPVFCRQSPCWTAARRFAARPRPARTRADLAATGRAGCETRTRSSAARY